MNPLFFGFGKRKNGVEEVEKDTTINLIPLLRHLRENKKISMGYLKGKDEWIPCVFINKIGTHIKTSDEKLQLLISDDNKVTTDKYIAVNIDLIVCQKIFYIWEMENGYTFVQLSL